MFIKLKRYLNVYHKNAKYKCSFITENLTINKNFKNK